jgi:transcriptional regulator NrdR family protein
MPTDKDIKELETIKCCPFCEATDSVVLVMEERAHIIKEKIVKAKIYLYMCAECNESFTTTKSDEASLLIIKNTPPCQIER